MKTIIAGGRDVKKIDYIRQAVTQSEFEITEIVSGGAPGADWLGELWAAENKIPLRRFNADWGRHGKAAGPIRNREMANYGEALIAVWDGKSKGTKNMIEQAQAKRLKVFIFKI